jgi:hypothetical protein
MFVYNNVVHDSRVLKSAATLAAAGWRVTVIGRQHPIDPPAAPEEERDGFRIVRVPLPPEIQDFLASVRRPWRVRHRVLPTVRRAIAQPPVGWLRLAGMAGGALLAAPWTAYRLADTYALGDRGPTLGRGGAADWWLHGGTGCGAGHAVRPSGRRGRISGTVTT